MVTSLYMLQIEQFWITLVWRQYATNQRGLEISPSHITIGWSFLWNFSSLYAIWRQCATNLCVEISPVLSNTLCLSEIWDECHSVTWMLKAEFSPEVSTGKLRKRRRLGWEWTTWGWVWPLIKSLSDYSFKLNTQSRGGVKYLKVRTKPLTTQCQHYESPQPTQTSKSNY